ncbi:uncharacterized protein HMPREF1541_02824 [Cyphellophora europaea CBS 101466]|uniref:CsbD-like domain-containing protein n=1 Tax=Cyphellophora europaea (strain CBS 101466) TaxID=1220924 RepID=W2S4Y4_CYPE1|nr:uncharacterized protein HMPREF1541_02824 [Cyphellophora europaea CBS 101466]ETN43665.1 hypothetical protein HMPREF1541_02824 [Cyphellophora europaea CBS 101466]
MSSTDNTTAQPSSGQSIIDTATSYVQSGIAAVTGNQSDKAKAEQTHNKAAAEANASEAAVKAGPFTLSSSGAVAKDSSERTQGQWDQTMGSLKETAGNLTGNESLKQQGREQNLQGQGQEAKGQLSDLGQGISDRVQGTLGGAVAGLTNDRESQQKYADIHDEGKSRQRGVEADLDKMAAAQEKQQQQAHK